MALGKDDAIIDALLVPPGIHASEQSEPSDSEDMDEITEEHAFATTLLTVTEFGYGKRTPFIQYRLQGRYGKGILSYRTSSTTGNVVGALEVAAEDELMLVTDTGRVIRISANSVRMVGRVSQGVRLMRLETDEKIVDITRIEDDEDEDEEHDDAHSEGTEE